MVARCFPMSLADMPPPPIADSRAVRSTIGGRQLRGLSDILDALDSAAARGDVSVGAMMDEIGIRSFAPLILVPAMILVSPLSGIPGLPSIGAAVMLLFTLQKLAGRPHIWLPDWLKRRCIPAHRLSRTVSWLRRPAVWIDDRTHRRMTWLVTRASNVVTLLAIAAICLLIPFLEVLPMVTSLFATAIAFFAIGLMARDGLFTVLAWIWIAAAVSGIAWLIPG